MSWRNFAVPGKYNKGGKYEPRDSCYGLMAGVIVIAVIVYGANGLLWCVDISPDAMEHYYGNITVTDGCLHQNCVVSVSNCSVNPTGTFTGMSPFVPLLLVLSGDVELNPGPETPQLATKDQVDKLTTMMSEMLAWSKGIDEKFTALSGRIFGLEQQNKVNTDKLKKLNELEAELNVEKAKNKATQDKLQDMNDRLDESEDRSRRNNLMFCGIEGNDHEQWDESEVKVKHFVKHNLGTQAGDGFERVHRIPNGPNAPIIVSFSRYKHKVRVPRQAYRLKNTDFFHS